MTLPDCYPDDYQDWLYEALGMNPRAEASAEIIAPLFALHQVWMAEGGATTAPAPGPRPSLAHPATLRAYACFYMTINLAKLWFVLDRCPRVVDRLLAREQVTVTELGCGPGTFLWAFAFWLMKRRPEALPRLRVLRGLDRCKPALALAKKLGQGLRARYPALAHVDCELVAADWHAERPQPADLLIFGNVLAEDDQPLPTTLAEVPASAVLVLEPGTAPVFRRVLPLRDHLLAAGWAPQFPCPRAATCPMAGTGNWCHFNINRFGLPFIQRIAGVAGLTNPRHHFCAFLFDHEPPAPPDAWRVLSNLRKENRSGIRYVCDGEALVEAVLNRRERNAGTRPFLEADAGDLLRLTLRGGRAAFVQKGRLNADDTCAPS